MSAKMNDNNMIVLTEIRNDYSLKKYGNLTSEQIALLKYDDLCVDLIKENKKYKEVIEKAIEYINGAYEMAIYTKSVSLDQENIEDLLAILKEVE